MKIDRLDAHDLMVIGVQLIGHPVHFAMQRKQLLKIRRQVETTAPSSA